MSTSSGLSGALSILTGRKLDVVCVGAALMDHLVSVDFDVLRTFDLVAGTMSLVDTAKVSAIRATTGEQRRVSGGAEANTAVGVASFGGKAAFVGAVGTDETGTQYAADLEAAGVRAVLDYVPVGDGSNNEATGSSFVIVTPDAERTMLTALGVAPRLDHRRIDDELLASAKIVYFSAYALDYPGAADLVSTIITKARQAGTLIALSLADPMSVERHHDTLVPLVRDGVDLVFANESEAVALSRAPDVDGAIGYLHQLGRSAIVTRGALGAIAVTEHDESVVAAVAVSEVVDATGAGDLFAAGVLYGLSAGLDLHRSAQFGALSAAEVIGHLGARPQSGLHDLAVAAGLFG